MNKFICLVLGAVFSLGVLTVRESDAAIYKYIDKDGVPCFADDLQVVPEQYRASAVIIEGESKDDAARQAGPAATKSAAPAMPAAGAETTPVKGPLPLSIRLLISTVVGAAALLIFMTLRKLPELKDNKKVLTVIRGSLIGVFSIYLVIAHVKDVMILFGMASHTVEEAQQRSAEKGKKAAQVIKSIDGMFEEAQKAQKTQEAGEAAVTHPEEGRK